MSPWPRLEGLLAAVHTPFDGDGRLNLDQVRPIVDHLVADGVGGILVCGTTGEGPLLTTEERRETATAYRAAGRGRMRVIVHVDGSIQISTGTSGRSLSRSSESPAAPTRADRARCASTPGFGFSVTW